MRPATYPWLTAWRGTATTATLDAALECAVPWGMKTLAPTDLAFFDDAPVRILSTAAIDASPARVFAAFADPAGWTHWFPRMYEAAWTSTQTAQLGAERLVKLRLFGNFVERMIAWEPGKRFAFTMTQADSPFARRLAEDYKLREADDGTTIIEWVFATEPTTLGRLAMPVMKGMMRRMFADAGVGLSKYLAAQG